MLDTRSEVLPYDIAYGLLHCIMHDTELRRAKSWMKKCKIK